MSSLHYNLRDIYFRQSKQAVTTLIKSYAFYFLQGTERRPVCLQKTWCEGRLAENENREKMSWEGWGGVNSVWFYRHIIANSSLFILMNEEPLECFKKTTWSNLCSERITLASTLRNTVVTKGRTREDSAEAIWKPAAARTMVHFQWQQRRWWEVAGIFTML